MKKRKTAPKRSVKKVVVAYPSAVTPFTTLLLVLLLLSVVVLISYVKFQ